MKTRLTLVCASALSALLVGGPAAAGNVVVAQLGGAKSTAADTGHGLADDKEIRCRS